MLNSYLFNKTPNPLGQQMQNFLKVIAIIYMEISSAVTGSGYRFFLSLSTSFSGVHHENLSVSARDLTWGLQTGLSKGHFERHS